MLSPVAGGRSASQAHHCTQMTAEGLPLPYIPPGLQGNLKGRYASHTHTHTHTEATPKAPLTFIQTRPCRHHAQLQQPDGRGGPEVQVEHQLTSKRSTEQVPGGHSGLGQKQHTMQGHVYTDWTIASSPPSLHNSLAPPYFTVGTEFTMQYSNNFLSLHCPYIYIYYYKIISLGVPGETTHRNQSLATLHKLWFTSHLLLLMSLPLQVLRTCYE